PVIVDGEPGDADRECFPPALRFEVGADGRVTDTPSKMLAADARREGDGRDVAVAKIVARLLGVRTDGIFRRAERERRQQLRRRNAIIAVLASLSLVALASAYYWRIAVRDSDAFADGLLDAANTIVAKVTEVSVDNINVEQSLFLLKPSEDLLGQIGARGRATSAKFKRRRASMLMAFASSYKRLGQTGEQRQRAEEARELLADLAKIRPKDLAVQHDLAMTNFEMASAFIGQGQLGAALDACKEAQAILSGVVRNAV